jgi:acetate kinase
MGWAGIVLDETLNQQARGETRISAADSKTQIWVVPTNEEIVVARQSAEAIRGK